MKHWQLLSLALVGFFAGEVSAQNSIQTGVIRKVNADKKSLTIRADGKELTLTVSTDTKVVDSRGKEIRDPFKNNVFASGAKIMFNRNDSGGLVAIRVIDNARQPRPFGIQRGQLVKVDSKNNAVTLKQNGKEIIAVADEKTRFFAAKGKTVKEKLDNFKAGNDVNFVIRPKDGKNYLVGIRLFNRKPGRGRPLVPFDSSKLIPINELGDKEYKNGFRGGFYPGGKNKRPTAHEAVGVRLASEIQPLDDEGKPNPNGKIVMISVGMSNTSQASNGFQKALNSASGVNPTFLFINGAVGGQTAAITQSTESPQGMRYWGIVDQRLKAAGASRAQVQVIWIKQADAGPNQGFPAYAKKLESELANLVQIFPKRFPNAKLVYLSSRTYGGYAKTALNPEPYAYESAFSVKWLIERQLKGEPALNFDPKKGKVGAPWLSWGPYLWANGSKKRADGFYYEAADFAGDGTHHSRAGSEKIGRHMLQFFQNDSTSRPWFMAKQR